MPAQQTTMKPGAIFEPNVFYEQMLREREENATRFALCYSLVMKRSLDAYERAKRKAEGVQG
jgi:hypothetical protein